RGAERGDTGAGDLRPGERDLRALAPASRDEPVQGHTGRVRTADGAERDRLTWVSSGQNASPGERSTHDDRELEDECDSEEAAVEPLDALRHLRHLTRDPACDGQTVTSCSVSRLRGRCATADGGSPSGFVLATDTRPTAGECSCGLGP